MEKKLLYIVNGLGFSKGMPPGGADKRAVEIGKRLQVSGVGIYCLTTDAGKEVLEKEGLKAEYIVYRRPKFWPKALENNLLGRMLSYLYVIFAQARSIGTIAKKLDALPTPYHLQPTTCIYPTSDMFFDVLPASWLKKRLSSARFVGIVHHWIPKNRPGDKIKNLGLYFYQRFGFWLLKKCADVVVLPENAEGEKIRKDLIDFGVPEKKLAWFRNGADVEAIRKVPEPKKEFEACFLGSIRPSKGIFDLVPIWKKILEEIPYARLLVIGGGLQTYVDQLKSQIKEAGLERNIVLAGVVPQRELYSKVKSCKIFISPSREEGWGIVVSEALAAGLPVVATDLPAFKAYKDLIIRVPLGDLDKFAEEIIRLLRDEDLIGKLSKKGKDGAKEFSWDTAATIEYASLEKLISR